MIICKVFVFEDYHFTPLSHLTLNKVRIQYDDKLEYYCV